MKIMKMLAAVMAAGMMAGCSASAPGYEVGAEPVATVPQVAVTEPTQKRGWGFGDIVYSLEAWPDGTVSVSRHAVVAHEGNVVIVTQAVSDSTEALRKCLPEYLAGGAETWTIDASELYSSWEQAQDAADELNSGR